MVTFDAATAGTPASAWSDAVRALPRPDLERVDHLVVVAAHPDDEILGAAGLMRTLALAGTRVHLVMATDGGASHPRSPSTSSEQLAALRARETDAALALIAPGAVVHRLRLPDGGLVGRAHELEAGIAAVVDDLAGSVLVASVWRGDGHADHELVGQAAAAVAIARDRELVEFPIWMWHWGAPGDDRVPWSRLSALPLDDATRAAKAAAIGEHRSQIAPLSERPGDEAVLHEGMLRHFRGRFETLIGAERDYFDELYASAEDPWGYDSRWYERRKRALALAALRRERYTTALELGCSTGAFTEHLADRADAVLAIDAAPAAVDRARARLAARSEVEVRLHDLAHGIPSGRWQLIVLSEVGYYLDESVLERVLAASRDALADDGELLLVHWRHPSGVLRRSAEAVHVAAERLGLHRQVQHIEADVLLDLWSVDTVSVAQREGLS